MCAITVEETEAAASVQHHCVVILLELAKVEAAVVLLPVQEFPTGILPKGFGDARAEVVGISVGSGSIIEIQVHLGTLY